MGKRTTLYQSWTIAVEFEDLEAVMGSSPPDDVLAMLAGDVQKAMGKQLIGYCYDNDAQKLLFTLRTKDAARSLQETWTEVIDMFLEQFTGPWEPPEGQ